MSPQVNGTIHVRCVIPCNWLTVNSIKSIDVAQTLDISVKHGHKKKPWEKGEIGSPRSKSTYAGWDYGPVTLPGLPNMSISNQSIKRMTWINNVCQISFVLPWQLPGLVGVTELAIARGYTHRVQRLVPAVSLPVNNWCTSLHCHQKLIARKKCQGRLTY